MSDPALRPARMVILVGLLVSFAPWARAQAGVADTPLPRFADGKQSALVQAIPGVVKRNGVETDFLCTSFAPGFVNIGVEVFSTDGAPLNDVSAGIGALLDVETGQTVTIGTGGTAAFLESTVITLPTVAQGSARIIATSTQVQCVTLIIDGTTIPPAASATIRKAVPPVAGTALSSPLPQFPDGKPATHSMLIPGVVNRGTLETDFFCTSLAAESIDIGVEVFGPDGGVLNSVANGNGAVVGVQPGHTVTLGTAGTAAFLETTIISVPGVAQGLARVVSTSERVICSALVLDSSLVPPASMSELRGYNDLGPGGTESPTPSSPTPTTTATAVPPTRTPRVTPTTIVGCTGDCSGDGVVTIDELVRGVNIALGSAPLGVCDQFDLDESGSVSVNELVRAVNVTLKGCVPGGPLP